jgi:hypothetical protein
MEEIKSEGRHVLLSSKEEKRRGMKKRNGEKKPSLFHASVVAFSSLLRFFPDIRHTGRTNSRSV